MQILCKFFDLHKQKEIDIWQQLNSTLIKEGKKKTGLIL